MSQDKFWEQWGAASSEKAEEPEKQAEGGEAPGGVDADVLAQWLQALPPADPSAPPGDPLVSSPQAPAASPSAGADALAGLWPPTAPVDPFAAVTAPSENSPAADWDLAFDLNAPPTAPAAAPAGLGEFDLSGLAGPAPAGDAPPPPAAAPVSSPFGPPPPPAAPPQEALQAQPLRLEITTGRRTLEQKIQGEALIGRPDATRGLHPEIDLRLDDAVSRRHAKIFVRNGRYVLTDLNSTNGTRHNREWLQPEVEVPLKTGDEIEVGEVTLIRVLEAPESHA